jgi:hypothetical protein
VRRSLAVLAVLGLFLVGVLVGVVGTHAFYLHRIHREGGLVGFATHLFADSLERRLDLDAAQKRQLETILADTGGDFRELHRQVGPQAMVILQKMTGRIEAMLSPEQKREYARFRLGTMRHVHELLLHRS